MIILGIDPGLANTGWGVVERDGPRCRAVAYGCISTKPKEPVSSRLRADPRGDQGRHRPLPSNRLRGRERLLRIERQERVRDRPSPGGRAAGHRWCSAESGRVLTCSDQERGRGIGQGRQAPGHIHGAHSARRSITTRHRTTPLMHSLWPSPMRHCETVGNSRSPSA